jgi:hypothetical protein
VLTRNGWAVVFVATVATLTWALLGYVGLAAVAVVAVAVLLPGLIWRVRKLAPYRLDLTVASTAVHRGDDAIMTVGVHRGGQGMMPVARVALTACGASVARLLRPRMSGEVWSVRAARRGRETVGLVVLTCQDPFGLWWRRVDASVEVAGTRVISVLPRFTPLREYSQVEDVRPTRWAAAETVLSRPAVTVHTGVRAVLLDVHRHPFHADDTRDDPFELAVDLAFSLIRSAALAGREVSLGTNADSDTGWHRDLPTITEVLTSVRACVAYPGCAAAPSLRDMVQRHQQLGGYGSGVDSEGSTVIVSTAPDAASVVAPVAGAGSRLVLFQVTTSRTGRRATKDLGGLRVIGVTSLAEAAQAWAEEVAPGSARGSQTVGTVVGGGMVTYRRRVGRGSVA